MNLSKRPTASQGAAFSTLAHTNPPPAQNLQDLTPPPCPPIRKSPTFIIVLTLHIVIISLIFWIPPSKPKEPSIHMMELIDLPPIPPTPEPSPPTPQPLPDPPLPDPPPIQAAPESPPLDPPPKKSIPEPPLSTKPPLSPPPPPAPTKKHLPPPLPPIHKKPVPQKPKIEISKEVVKKPIPPKKDQPSSTTKPHKKSDKEAPSKSSPSPASSRSAVKQDFTPYYALIRERMNRVWKQPVQYAHQDPKAIIRIHISSTGKIVSATLEESSGIEEFDQSALDAALEAKEIGAARPVGMSESVTITFRLDGSN